MYQLGQAERPRIPEVAGRPWVRTLLTQTFGYSDPTLEQHYTNSLRIGAMTFAEVQTDVAARATRERPAAAPTPPRAAPPRPRVSVPAPPGRPAPPAGGGVADVFAAIPTWGWLAGGGAVLGLMLLSMGRR